MDSARPLNYAPRPSAARRYSRRVYQLVTLAALAVAALTWGRGILRAWESLYWERQCLAFAQPANHIVWEMNRGNVIHCENIMERSRFMGAKNIALNSGTIFLHEMRFPDGTRRLLSLDFSPIFPSTPGQFRLQMLQWDISPWPRMTNWSYILVNSNATPLSHFKFYAGQPDPNDPSHFSFDFDIDNQKHTADGWLKNDGQLLVSVRP